MNQAPVPGGYPLAGRYPSAGPGVVPMRVTDRDRDATVEVLQSAYTIGRLTRAEHDARVGQALAATIYPELDSVTADLPERPVYPDFPHQPPQPRLNGLAVAALICGAAQPVTVMLTTIPAIALGHVARSQIKRTGDDGRALATWGLALGWAGLGAVVMLGLTIVLAFLVIAGSNG